MCGMFFTLEVNLLLKLFINNFLRRVKEDVRNFLNYVFRAS